jgi:hypothetical protein
MADGARAYPPYISVRKESGYFQWDSVAPAKACVQAHPAMVPRVWIAAAAAMTRKGRLVE